MKDDVVGVLDQLDLGPTTLIGHSMGGVVAYQIAMQHPELVERLVIEDVSPPSERDAPIPERPDDTRLSTLIGRSFPPSSARSTPANPKCGTRSPRFPCPHSSFGGGPDSHIPQEKLAEVADRIQRCDLITIDAGHHVHRTQPAEFAAAVLRWIEAT